MSGGAPSQLMSTFVNELLENGVLQQHISTVVIPKGQKRQSIMLSAIEEHLKPLGVITDKRVTGGYCIWLKLPNYLQAAEVCRKSVETQNLTLGCGDVFEVPGSGRSDKDLHQCLRLCFMWEDERRLVEGIKRLAIVVSELLRG